MDDDGSLHNTPCPIISDILSQSTFIYLYVHFLYPLGGFLTQAFIFPCHRMNGPYCVSMKIGLQTLPATNLMCFVQACF